MITLEELGRKALRPWSTGEFLKHWLSGETIFPLKITLKTPLGKTLVQDFAKVRNWIAALKENDRDSKGWGYRIDYKSVNHRHLGPQDLPHCVYFDGQKEWLKFIGKERDFIDFQNIKAETQDRLPALLHFLAFKPLVVLDHRKDWEKLLAICNWFKDHPRSGLYLRQLDIPGIDTKFIESRRGILTLLLDRVLNGPADKNCDLELAKHRFEQRFGLKYDPPLIRLRILDQRLAICGFTDLALPIEDIAVADFKVKTVFITENKINGLCFPNVSDALIIFGLGYGIEMLPRLTWLKDIAIYYWGDIDTHGFAMLSQIRSYFPQTQSLLMDTRIFLQYRHLWGTESTNRRFTGELCHLTPSEQQVFTGLKENRWGRELRLEQEHIAYSSLLEVLEGIPAI